MRILLFLLFFSIVGHSQDTEIKILENFDHWSASYRHHRVQELILRSQFDTQSGRVEEQGQPMELRLRLGVENSMRLEFIKLRVDEGETKTILLSGRRDLSKWHHVVFGSVLPGLRTLLIEAVGQKVSGLQPFLGNTMSGTGSISIPILLSKDNPNPTVAVDIMSKGWLDSNFSMSVFNL